MSVATLAPVLARVRVGKHEGELLRRRPDADAATTLVIAIGERLVVRSLPAAAARALDERLAAWPNDASAEPIDLDALIDAARAATEPGRLADIAAAGEAAPTDPRAEPATTGEPIEAHAETRARVEHAPRAVDVPTAPRSEPHNTAPRPHPPLTREPEPAPTPAPPAKPARPTSRTETETARRTTNRPAPAILVTVSRLRTDARLLQTPPADRPTPRDPDDLFATRPAREVLAPGFEPRPYQSEAVAAWLANDGRGILNMATGTGKTFTSLLAAATLWPQARLVVVACPTRILVDQWRRAIREVFPISAIADVGHDPNWRDAAPLPDGPTFLVGTLQGLSRSAFREWFEREQDPAEALLIADEVHRVGSPGFGRLLDIPFRWRLGLSATPRRDWDAAGNRRLRLSFDKEVYHYGLGAAIENGILVPYTYHVHPLPMTPKERKRYKEVSSRLVVTLGGMGFDPERASLARFLEERRRGGDGDAETVRGLLVKRAKLLKEARTKETRIRDVLDSHDLPNCLVYCNTKRQVDDFARVLAAMNRPAVRYTSGMDRAEREQALAAFNSEAVGTIIAIKCLDEGVDIPDARSAILVSSSTTEREFIQRRGRVLRRAPGKHEAAIHDLLVLPVEPASFHGELEGAERAAALKEVRRAAVFNRFALNSDTTRDALRDLLVRLGFQEAEAARAAEGGAGSEGPDPGGEDETSWELAAAIDPDGDDLEEAPTR